MLLTAAQILAPVRAFRPGKTFVFPQRVSVLVGDNGAGKSTLLGLIRAQYRHHWTPSAMATKDTTGTIALTPAPSDAPDLLLHIDLSQDHMQGRAEFDERHFALQASLVGLSFGQVTLRQCAAMLEATTAPLVLIDEPEKGLSLAKQRAMLEVLACAIEEAPHRQFLISTHSPTIAHGLAQQVLALPEGRWMDTAAYFSALEAHGADMARRYRAARQAERPAP